MEEMPIVLKNEGNRSGRSMKLEIREEAKQKKMENQL
jgi:hypothetical protein